MNCWSAARDSQTDMLMAMRSSANGRIDMALPSSVWSRHTNPGLRSARALMGSSWERKPSMIGSSSGARIRPMFACARWKRVTNLFLLCRAESLVQLTSTPVDIGPMLAPAPRRSFDDLIGSEKQRLLDWQSHGLGGPEVEDQCEFRGLLDRDRGRGAPLEDLVHEVWRSPPELREAHAVGQQPAALGVFVRPGARQPVRRGEFPETSHVRDEHRVTQCDQAICAATDHQGKGVIELPRGSCRRLEKLNIQSRGHLLHGLEVHAIVPVLRIQQDRDSGKARHSTFEYLQPLSRELRTKKGRSRDVPTGPRDAVDDSVGHRIGAGRHDDGDRRCRLLEDADPRSARNDHVRLETDQLSGEGRQPIIPALRPPVFDDNILALNVAQVAESLPHRLDLPRVAGSGGDPE